MPDISYGVSLNVKKGFLDSRLNVSGITASMSEAEMQSLTYVLTTNATEIATDSLSSVGVAFMRNISTSTAATAQVGVVAGTSFISFATLKCGEAAILRLTEGSQYKAVGNTGARLRVDVTGG